MDDQSFRLGDHGRYRAAQNINGEFMPMSFSPSTIAKWEKGNRTPTDICTVGYVVVDGESLRLVDPDRSDFKIDIVDPRFCRINVLKDWPIKPTVSCMLSVDVEWVLSTVRICRVNELTIRFPIDEPNGIACLWPPGGPMTRSHET